MLPFEFIVEGTPISVQAKYSLKWWKQKVTDAAKLAWPVADPPLRDELQIIITYFYVALPRIDTDNMIKPIQDALIGIIYDDDYQITDVRARRLTIKANYSDVNVSPLIIASIAKKREFVHIKINLPVDKMRLDL